MRRNTKNANVWGTRQPISASDFKLEDLIKPGGDFDSGNIEITYNGRPGAPLIRVFCG
jgi:hypothetical protein